MRIRWKSRREGDRASLRCGELYFMLNVPRYVPGAMVRQKQTLSTAAVASLLSFVLP